MVSALRRFPAALRPDLPALRLVLPPFVASKAIALLVPFLYVYSISSTPGHPSGGALVETFGKWDAEHYRAIAEHGYPAGPLDLVPGHPGHLWGFFPGFPLMLRVLTFVIPDIFAAGIVLNSVAELAALYFLARLVMAERDTETAEFSAWLLALYPFAVFLTALYTESTFLAFAMASLYYMRQGRHTAACIAAGGAIAVRITGIALIPALIIEYLVRRRWRPGGGLIDLGFAVLPLVLFIVYANQQTGDGLAYQHVQQSASFGSRSITWPWTAASNTFNLSTSSQASSYDYLFMVELVANTLGFVAVALMWVSKRIPRSLAAYATGVWLLSGCLSYWQGTPRYLMAIIAPVALLLADALRQRPPWRWTIIAVSGGLMAFNAAALASGRFVA